jgi:hypothetical protein
MERTQESSQESQERSPLFVGMFEVDDKGRGRGRRKFLDIEFLVSCSGSGERKVVLRTHLVSNKRVRNHRFDGHYRLANSALLVTDTPGYDVLLTTVSAIQLKSQSSNRTIFYSTRKKDMSMPYVGAPATYRVALFCNAKEAKTEDPRVRRAVLRSSVERLSVKSHDFFFCGGAAPHTPLGVAPPPEKPTPKTEEPVFDASFVFKFEDQDE